MAHIYYKKHRRRKRGGRGGRVPTPPLNFRWAFFFFFFFCLLVTPEVGRCCVPRVPLPNNVNDVRKLSPLISFFGSCASDFIYILSQAWRARKNHARPPLNFCASAANDKQGLLHITTLTSFSVSVDYRVVQIREK